MRRLVVNPGTPQAWEIELKPGTNLLGRGFANDFKLYDPSISGSHCQVVVGDDAVTIKDLGSTNGTFVDGRPVQEAHLEPGQAVRLGALEMVFEADVNEPVVAMAWGAAPPSPVRVVARQSAPVRVAAPPVPPPISSTGTAFLQTGPRFCKFHPKSPARHLCTKCNRTFCDLCVMSRNVGGTLKQICRTCGVECVPLQAQVARPVSTKGFFGRLPGVLIYPFRGSGVLVFLFATLIISGLQILAGRSFLFFIFLEMITIGYIFSYMQSIIQSTAADESEMPPLPGFDGLFGAFFRLLGTVLMSFGLPIILLGARLGGVGVPVSAIVATMFLGSLYFPMAFLAVAMKDTVMAANPLVVLPAILKVPLEYVVAAILFGGIFGIQRLGDIVTGGIGQISLSTREMSSLFIAFGIQLAWTFVSMYLLTINMRILGLLYLTKKDKLGWFNH